MPAFYKPGQGYYTRVFSGVAVGLLGLMGAAWIWDVLRAVNIEGVEDAYISATGAVLLLLILGGLGYWFIGRKPRVVEFMIATEGEMKKVHWSNRREILGSTWVVIGLTIFTAVFIFVLDYLVFSQFFQWVGVLDAGA